MSFQDTVEKEIGDLCRTAEWDGKSYKLCEDCELRVQRIMDAAAVEYKAELEKTIRAYLYKTVCDLGIKVKDNKDAVIPVEDMTVKFLIKVLADKIKRQRNNSSVDEALNQGDGTYKP